MSEGATKASLPRWLLRHCAYVIIGAATFVVACAAIIAALTAWLIFAKLYQTYPHISNALLAGALLIACCWVIGGAVYGIWRLIRSGKPI